MKRMILAAVAAATLAFGAAAPAQAHMGGSTLNTIAPATPLLQDVHYRSYRHSHGYTRYPRHSYRHRSHRYRHCYNERVRVHIPGGNVVFRTNRRCGWRWR